MTVTLFSSDIDRYCHERNVNIDTDDQYLLIPDAGRYREYYLHYTPINDNRLFEH